MTENLSRLFVGSLPYNLTEGQLLELFVPFGRVISVAIIRDRRGNSRGLGYVEFDHPSSALEAKSKLHNKQVFDRTIIVDYAKLDPMQTEEGRARYKPRHPLPPPRPIPPKRPRPGFAPRPISKIKIKSKRLRQSVFDSRRFGARSGAKFASKTKYRRRK